MKTLITLFVLINGLIVNNSSNSPENLANIYIDTYSELAVIEMHRSGIPASIILAQALHESNYGTSDLANNANNHFGIKCKSYWQGDTYYHKDDDFDKNGKLTDSCFRKYNSTIESFVDHSNFLMKTSHYQVLFKFDRYDYENWANGLKICGYATDPNYANKLIKLVEKYNLNQYDYWTDPFRSTVK